jgi:hypothetical protein
LWEEIYTQKMNEDRNLEKPYQNYGLTLRNMEKIRELKCLLRASLERLDDLGNDPIKNEGLLINEKAILEVTHKEIRRLQKEGFNLEFDLG